VEAGVRFGDDLEAEPQVKLRGRIAFVDRKAHRPSFPCAALLDGAQQEGPDALILGLRQKRDAENQVRLRAAQDGQDTDRLAGQQDDLGGRQSEVLDEGGLDLVVVPAASEPVILGHGGTADIEDETSVFQASRAECDGIHGEPTTKEW
jgi:hypothetical protein